MNPSDKTPEDAVLRARLAALKSGLAEVSKTREGAASKRRADSGDGSSLGLGLRIASEFVSAVLVGVAIGFFIDRAASTSPLFLVIFLMLGMAAGFLNIHRLSSRTTGRPGDGQGGA